MNKETREHVEWATPAEREIEIINVEAAEATEVEHNATVRECLQTHLKTVLWCVVVSGTIIMEGYDKSLINSFFAYPSFQKQFGREISPGKYQLQGKWQVSLSIASNVGIVFALGINGYLIEKFGHRRVIMASLVAMASFVFISFFATTKEVLLVGQILCGLPWGVFTTMGPTYSSEIAPLALRGHLTAYVNMCWAIGQFVAAGVLKGLVSNNTKWSYKIPFAVQWVWVPGLMILTFLAPDSPWWLVRKGRIEDAEKAVKRLTHKSIHNRAKQSVAMMIRTTELERSQEAARADNASSSGWRSYIELFKGSNLRRTEIACITFSGQSLCGSTFAYSPSYFFSQAGLNPEDTYKMNLGTTSIAFVGTVCSWFLLNRLGRRTIYVTGFGIMTGLLLLVGILAFPAESKPAVKWAQAAIILGWVATYALSIGPITFTIVSEISSTTLRAQSIALARNTYNICAIVAGVVEPYLMNPTEANLKGKTAFVWFGTSTLVFLWAFFRLPETQNRTYEELDVMFEHKIPSRQFASYVIDQNDLGLGRVSVDSKRDPSLAPTRSSDK